MLTRHVPAAIAIRPAEEDGFSLIELVVVCALLSVVLIPVLGVLDATNRVAANDQERNTALVEDADGFRAMNDELRQAYKVVGPTTLADTNWIDVLIRHTTPGTTTVVAQRVLYRCDVASPVGGLRECVRYQGATTDPAPPGTPPAGAVAHVILPRIANGTGTDPVFTNLAAPNGPATRPSYFRSTVKVPSAGSRAGSAFQHSVVLDDSVYMRNLDLAQ